MSHRLALLASVMLSACGQRPAARVEAPTRVVSSEPVLATVNGAPILASDLPVQAGAARTPRDALAQLIQQELLVQEAARRGLDHHPSVLDMQRRAMVELLVRRSFRDQIGAQQIPRRLVEQAYRKNLGRFVHGELVEVYHLYASTSKKRPLPEQEAARQLAVRAHALATARPLTPEQFVAIAAQVGPEDKIHAEKLPPHGYDWFVPSFADACRPLKPGAVSGVVETRYGYHVIYFIRRIPAINVPLEQAEAEIRTRILDESRAILLQELIDKLEKEGHVKLMPQNLPGLGEARP
jgi:peptidyl-prolyl cis-trans isomerase C